MGLRVVGRLHLCSTYDVDVEHIVPYLLRDGCDDALLSYKFNSLYKLIFLYLSQKHY